MSMKNNKVTKEIERLVNKYPWGDSKELFRAELEYLVLIAEKEQMKKDQKATMEILKNADIQKALTKAQERRYEKAVGQLDDDTGYFDHDFSKSHLANELALQRQEIIEEIEEKLPWKIHNVSEKETGSRCC